MATQSTPLNPQQAAADKQLREEITYWSTHTATTPQDAQQKLAAYTYANDVGIKGAIYPNQDELKLAGASGSSPSGTKQVGTGAAAGAAVGSIGGPVGGAIGGIVGGAAGGLAAAFGKKPSTGLLKYGSDPNADPLQYTLPGSGSPSTPTAPGTPPPTNLSTPTLPPGAVPPPTATTQLQGLAQQPPAAGAAPVAKPKYTAKNYTTSSTPISSALTPQAFTGGVTAAAPGSGQILTQYPVAPPAGSDPYGTSAATQLYNATWGPTGPIQAAKTLTSTNNQVDQNLGANLSAEQGLIGGYQTFNNGLMAQGNQDTATANQGLTSVQGNYNTNLGTLNGLSVGNYGQLANTLGGEQVLTATPYQGDWVSNPTDVANETNSLNTLNGVGAGSLNYTAQQAQLYQAALTLAQSNGTDVANEYASLQQLQNIANGSLNVTNGQDSPEALAAQKSALQQLSALTNPQRTAQEEFLYEQQRQQETQQEASSRAAVMQNLRERGMSGSGMELTNQLGADQINSQNRLLGDLGTQATAVGRATTDLQNYATLGTNMNAQGNAIAQGNQGVQAGAATATGQLASNIRGQSDNMSMFNANAANSNSQFNANAANVNSQFNANAQNVASANNQQTMLTGDVQAGQLSASMRNASDAVGLANKNQQGISNRFADSFALQGQEDLTGRAIATNNAGNTAIGQLSTNNNNYLSTNQGTIGQVLGNQRGQLNADATLGTNNYNAGQQGIQDTTGYWNGVSGRATTNLNGSIGAIGAAGGPTGQLIGTDQVTSGAAAANGATGSLGGGSLFQPPTPYVPSTSTYTPTPNPIPTSAASTLNGLATSQDPWNTKPTNGQGTF